MAVTDAEKRAPTQEEMERVIRQWGTDADRAELDAMERDTEARLAHLQRRVAGIGKGSGGDDGDN